MSIQIFQGDCRKVLATMLDASVHCVVTSPPYYGLRDYGVDGQIGLETTPDEYVVQMVAVFREVRRVLRDDGTCWVNLGDSYAGGGGGNYTKGTRNNTGQNLTNVRNRPEWLENARTKPKDLLMMPARVALALQADGWWIRSQLPWIKRSCMPESCTDRPSNAIEYVYLLTKSERYYWDAEAVKREGAVGAGTRAAKGSNVRSALKDVNGRPPQYWEYTGSRNFRNSDLFFGSLQAPHGLICDADGNPLALDVNTAAFAGAHFATFPPKLIEPLIMGSTSERGCCTNCGAPWAREVERRSENRSNAALAGTAISGKGHVSSQIRDGHDIRNGPTSVNTTTGWSPSCKCKVLSGTKAERGEVGSAPCVVLDPFAGSGTTGLVADRLGRDAKLIDLNTDYCRMAVERVKADSPLFTEVMAAD